MKLLKGNEKPNWIFHFFAKETCWPNQFAELLSRHLRQLLRRESGGGPGSLTHRYPYPWDGCMRIVTCVSICRCYVLLMSLANQNWWCLDVLVRVLVALGGCESLPCCSRCCRWQMAKIYSKLRRRCILERLVHATGVKGAVEGKSTCSGSAGNGTRGKLGEIESTQEYRSGSLLNMRVLFRWYVKDAGRKPSLKESLAGN